MQQVIVQKFGGTSVGSGERIAAVAEIIKKEAKEYSKDFENRLKHMIIHGFLHLLNFNHEAKHERIKMEDLERNIMDTISAGEPY